MDFFSSYRRSTSMKWSGLAMAVASVFGTGPLATSASAQSYNTRETAQTLPSWPVTGEHFRQYGPRGNSNFPIPGLNPPSWNSDPMYFDPNPGDFENTRDSAAKPCSEQSGNPVMLSSGNKIERTVDFVSDGEMPLTLERTYNSFWPYATLMGNWLTPFDYTLVRSAPTNTLWLQRPDGRRIRFNYNVTLTRWEEDKASSIATVTVTNGIYTHLTENGGSETYNAQGYVLSVRNRHGIGWNYQYSGGGGPINRIIQITHTNGRGITIAHNRQASRLVVTDPDNRAWVYSMSYGTSSATILSVTPPGTNPTVTRYTYSFGGTLGPLVGIDYNNVRHATFGYDSDFRATSTEHSGGVERHSFVWTGKSVPPALVVPDPPDPTCNPDTGQCENPEPPAAPTELEQQTARYRQVLSQPQALTRVVDTNALGRATTHDLSPQLAQITETRGAQTANCPSSVANRFYDANGYLDYTLDFNGNRTEYTFNALGQLTSRIDGAGSPVARTTTMTWTTTNQVESMTVVGMQRTEYSYDANQRLASIATVNVSPFGTLNQTLLTNVSYTYHPNGMVQTMTVDGPLQNDDEVTTYSAAGDRLSVSNSLNHTVSWSGHNGRGQPGRMTGMNGETFDFVYDEQGRLTSVTTLRNGSARMTSYVYAASGLLDRITGADGVVERYQYDAARRLTAVNRELGDITLKHTREYDIASNLRWLRGFVVDGPIDRQISELEFRFDEQNRLIRRLGSALKGDDTPLSIAYGYDLNSNLTSIKPSTRPATTIAYDALDREMSRTDGAGGTIQMRYDAIDQITRITDPRGLHTDYQRNGLRQLLRTTSPDTGVTIDTWDGFGLRTERLRADGVTETYAYDAIGRLVGRGAFAESQSFVYDSASGCANGIGRLCAVNDGHQTLTFSWNAYGERTLERSVVDGQTIDTSYAFDPVGRLTGITYPGNVSVTYTHIPGHISAMSATMNGSTQTVFSQGARRFLASGLNVLADEWVFGNGLTHGIAMDRDGRFSRRVTGSNQAFVIRRDASGRINQRQDIADPVANAAYGYDEADRLASASTSANGVLGFTHDLTGNRLSQTVDGVTENLTISATSNRISSISGFTRSYSYKATGEITAITGGAADLISESRFETPLRNLSLSYDPFNRLSQITGQNLTATYAIAGTGMRVKKAVNGKTTRFHYSANGQLLYEKESTGKTTQHLYHRGEPIGVIRDNTLFIVVNDHLGRPEQIFSGTDASLKWKATNLAFGRKIVTTDQIGGYQLGFPGQYHDEETGFAYNVMRDYDQSSGRYLQPDPIGLADSVNLYAYVSANPIKKIDQLGLYDIFSVIDLDLTGITGGEVSIGYVIDTDDLWESGLYFSANASVGVNVGIGVGAGFTFRDIEGKGACIDANLGTLSPSVLLDDKGLNGFSLSVGPGTGISGSLGYTATLSAVDIVRFWTYANDGR
jgi:RHS repeat-associated protein